VINSIQQELEEDYPEFHLIDVMIVNCLLIDEDLPFIASLIGLFGLILRFMLCKFILICLVERL
jgi:hypothetical protein